MQRIYTNIILLFCLLTNIHLVAQDQNEKKWNGKKFAISFTYDDALNVHLDKAIPVLDSYDMKATFYVPAYSGCLMTRKEEWASAARNGHELGNHTLFHPCSAKEAGMDWVKPEYDLGNYNLGRILDEIRLANNILESLDGKTDRSFAYTCGHTKAGNESFVDEIKNDFVSARGVDDNINNLHQTDLFQLNTFIVDNTGISQLVAAVDRAKAENAYLVFLFHGVGGEHPMDCNERTHKMLIEYIAKMEEEVWVAPVVEVSNYIKKYQNQ